MAWSSEKQKENMQEVIGEISNLLNKIAGFAEDLGKVGLSLERAQSSL